MVLMGPARQQFSSAYNSARLSLKSTTIKTRGFSGGCTSSEKSCQQTVKNHPLMSETIRKQIRLGRGCQATDSSANIFARSAAIWYGEFEVWRVLMQLAIMAMGCRQ